MAWTTNPYFANVPVILMTANTTKKTLTEALQLCIMGYVIKPPILESMRAKIKASVN
jgi:response regulator of citrate/malate metabolism